MLWWIPKILHAEWAQRPGEKSFWLIHRPSEIWNSQHKPSASVYNVLVDGIAESFRKEPRRARKKIFDVKNPQRNICTGHWNALMDMAQVYTLCCIPRALRWPLGKECRATCWAEVWKKKKKVFDSVCASFAEELAPGEAANKSQSKQDQKNIKSSLQQQQQQQYFQGFGGFPTLYVVVCALGSSREFALDFS